MMSPNRANIDQWLFDYFEGNLDPAQEGMLEEFLLENPEFDADMEAWGSARAISGVDQFPDAERLKRPAVILPLFVRWASVFVLLLGIAGSIFYLNMQFSTEQYAHVPLSESYFNSIDSELNAAETTQDVKPTDDVLVFTQNSDIEETSSVSSHIAPVSNNNNSINNNIIIAATTNSQAKASNGSSSNKEDEPFVKADMAFVNQPITVNPIMSEPPVQVDESEIVEQRSKLEATHKEESKAKSSLLSDMTRSVKKFVRSDLGLINLRDPHYMVPGMTQNDINFAHTGSLLATRVYSNTFVQWPSHEGQTIATQLGIDSYVSALHGGIGFQMNYSNYQAGMFENYEGAVTYSPKFKAGKNVVIEPALRFKMGSRNLNANRITPGNQIEWERSNVRTLFPDGETPQGEQIFYKDLGVGMLVNTKWAFIGVNVDNLARHNNDIYSNPSQESPSRANLNYVLTVGTDYESFNKRTSMSTYLLYQNYGNLNKGWLGVNFRYRFMTVGASLSTQLDPVASIGLSFDRFKISYVTDYTTNNITGNRLLSHQLSLRFVSKPNRNSRKLMN